MNRLYALFVAVNEYKSEDISTLRGCVKDIRKLETFLTKHYAGSFDLQIKTLENAQATYKNVINTFRIHLKQAGPDDTVWFHFSGHGSEENTAVEFLGMEPSGLDQTLLCHDSHSGTTPNLADKELAALLHEISTEDVNGNPKDSPHVVVSLDSCHSGSGTRDISDELIMPRSTPSSGKGRSLNSYYNGFYSSQSQLSVPISKHILLSACENIQTAGDTSQGGIFSTSLSKALTDTRGEINYIDLFLRARSVTKGIRKFQTPQFQSISNFNPYTRFLTGDSLGKPDKYEVIKENGDWFIKCGAVHGLPTNITSDIDVEIRSPDPEDQLISKAVITSVGAQKSRLDVKTGFSFSSLIDKIIPGDDPYRGVIMKFPAAPFYVILNETQGSLQHVRDEWDDAKNIKIAKTETEKEEAKIEVNARDGKFNIKDFELNERTYWTENTKSESAEILMDSIERIAKWYRTRTLKNENQHSRLGKLVDFQVETDGETKERTTRLGTEIKIFVNKDNTIKREELDEDARYIGVFPQVVIKNAKQKLYFYLLQFTSDYGIVCEESEIFFQYNAERHKTPYSVTQDLWKFSDGVIGLKKGQNENVTRFKLIATTEQLEITQLTQSGLFADRSGIRRLQRDKISNDWWVCDMIITVVRQDNSINSSKAVDFADGQVQIQPHAGLRAKVSVANAQIGSRSSDPVSAFAALQHTELNLMSFDTERSMSPRNVIELDEIKIEDGQSLEENPLDIVLRDADAEGWTLPVIFDGQNFISVGDSENKDGQSIVHVREIPPVSISVNENGQVENPFVPEVQDRSLFQTAKLAFFKLVLKKEEGLNLLKRVAFDADGGFKQTKDGLGSKINAAQNILLVVHGLLGDTKSIVKDLQGSTSKMLEEYDLILAFDYENLNQELDSTASSLKDQLSNLGIGSNKKINILAHGSGGLIARWMVEQLGANGWVDRLTLVGTPNGGTVYGKIGSMRKFASSAMDTALNFIPNLIPGAGLILKALRTTTDLTGSLAQMNPGSGFMNTLNSSEDPEVPYQIISGNVKLVTSGPSGGIPLLSRISKKLSDVFQPGENHDLFSTVASMENRDGWVGRNPLPEIEPTIPSFHFNYFKNGLGNANSHLSKESMKASQANEEDSEQSDDEPIEAVESSIQEAVKAETKQAVPSAIPLTDSSPEKSTPQVEEEKQKQDDAEPGTPHKDNTDVKNLVAKLAIEIDALKKKLAEKKQALKEAIKRFNAS